MASVFYDAKEILLMDYLEKGKTINFEYYCNFLDQLHHKIIRDSRGVTTEEIFGFQSEKISERFRGDPRRSRGDR